MSFHEGSSQNFPVRMVPASSPDPSRKWCDCNFSTKFGLQHASLKSEEINSVLSSLSIGCGPLEDSNKSSARPKSNESEHSEGLVRNRLQEALEGKVDDPSDLTNPPSEPKGSIASKQAGKSRRTFQGLHLWIFSVCFLRSSRLNLCPSTKVCNERSKP